MENRDRRWKQRFQNFEKAFLFFAEITEKQSYTPIEIGGLVHAFEIAFELGCKTIKDYLFKQGIETHFPRETLKEGFNTHVIEDGHTWIEMLEKGNELSHTYNEEVAHRAVEVIQKSYYPAIRQVYSYFKQKIDE
jgi:nucleotidyltransferase substrate binding protein (TIGR01987 family)